MSTEENKKFQIKVGGERIGFLLVEQMAVIGLVPNSMFKCTGLTMDADGSIMFDLEFEQDMPSNLTVQAVDAVSVQDSFGSQ